MKYKKGNLVTITACKHGHEFNIGEQVMIVKVYKAAENYKAKSISGEEWWIQDDEIAA